MLTVLLPQGTTFSGVAFAFATNNEAKEDIITEWPGAGSYTKQKVCTPPIQRPPVTFYNADLVLARFLPSCTTINTKR